MVQEHGVQRLSEIRRDLAAWLIEHEYNSIKQLQGSMSAERLIDPSALERANYLRVLGSWRPVMARQHRG